MSATFVRLASLVVGAAVMATSQCVVDESFGPPLSLDAPAEFTVQFSTKSTTTFSVKVRAKTTGYMGIGFSESGHMMGSDIVTMAVVDGAPRVEDRFAEWVPFNPSDNFVTPSIPAIDACQSWTTKCSYEGGGYTEFILSRAYNTSDGQDRVVDPNALLKFIFAWSMMDTISYHGINRGTTMLRLNSGYPAPFSAPADATGSIDLILSDYTHRDTRSRYVLKVFDLGETERHIVAVEPIIPESDTARTHHMVLYSSGKNRALYNNFATIGSRNLRLNCSVKTCDSDEFSPLGLTGLGTDVIFGWAKGAGPITFPAEAGFKIGATSDRYVILEVHVDDISGSSGFTITSGLRLHTTTILRPNDVGTIVLGNPAANMIQLAANKSRIHREGTCPTSCTNGFKGPVTMFRSTLHMHTYGKEIWTTKHSSSGSELLAFKQFWNFGFQDQISLNVTMRPGEWFSTHCIYDTSLASNPVIFGRQTSQEMCMNLISYYPKSNFDGLTCGNTGGTNTICRRAVSFWNNPIPDGTIALPEHLVVGTACTAGLGEKSDSKEGVNDERSDDGEATISRSTVPPLLLLLGASVLSAMGLVLVSRTSRKFSWASRSYEPVANHDQHLSAIS